MQCISALTFCLFGIYFGMKVCRTCLLKKDISEFHKDSRSKDGFEIRCKDCRCAIQRKSYVKNRKKRLKYAQNRHREHKKKLYKYLLMNPCVVCGEKDPIVLVFDHIERTSKIIAIGRAVGSWPWERIKTEIDKCQVLCCNCHARKTAKEDQWYKCIGKNI